MKSLLSSVIKKLDAPKIKLVVLRDCFIGKRACREGEVVEVYEVIAHITFQSTQEPRAVLAPGESFKTHVDKLEEMAASWDVGEVYRASTTLGDVEDVYPSEKEAAADRAKAAIGVRGPAAKVTAVRDGRIAGRRVKAGETIEVAEADAVDAMRSGMVKRSSSNLTRNGARYLNGAIDEYAPPDPGTREIPKIKLVATRDNVRIGHRIAMKGEVVEISEDVAYVLLRPIPALPGGVFDGRNRDPGYQLAPRARFTMSKDQLEEAAKKLASGCGIFDVV